MTRRIVEYWQKIAERDVRVARSLFQSKHYVEALFFGQLILEKILKANVVARTKKDAPRIHDLLRLATLGGIALSGEEKRFLDEMTRFNLEARYPDYKLRIYRTATKSFTHARLKKVFDLYQKYAEQL